MHHILLALTFLSAIPVLAQQNNVGDAKKYSQTITADDLKQRLYYFASPAMEGRSTATRGERRAAAYIESQFKAFGLQPGNGTSYRQPFVVNRERLQAADTVKETFKSANIIGIIPGTDKKDEYVIVTAHYDHMGINEAGILFPGADDDGSGTMAVLEMAEALGKARADGNGPRRSVIFMTVSGEEKGLWGSAHYADHPIYPLENTVVNLNVDMVGRIGEPYLADKDSANYLFVIGDDRLSTDLRPINEAANKNSVNLKLDYRYNGDDPNRFYFRSDHYNFAKLGVPAIFYFNGVHADYHQPGDTPDKINYPLYAKRVQLIFTTLWEMANRDEKVKRDLKLWIPERRR